MIRDVMQSSGLAIYAEVGLVLFLVAFVAMMARAMFMRSGDVDAVSQIPLDDAPAPSEEVER